MIHATWNTKTIGHRRCIADECFHITYSHVRCRESIVTIGKVQHGSTFQMLLRSRRCIADVGTRVLQLKIFACERSAMHRRCIVGTFRLYENILTIIWKPTLTLGKQIDLYLNIQNSNILLKNIGTCDRSKLDPSALFILQSATTIVSIQSLRL